MHQAGGMDSSELGWVKEEASTRSDERKKQQKG